MTIDRTKGAAMHFMAIETFRDLVAFEIIPVVAGTETAAIVERPDAGNEPSPRGSR